MQNIIDYLVNLVRQETQGTLYYHKMAMIFVLVLVLHFIVGVNV